MRQYFENEEQLMELFSDTYAFEPEEEEFYDVSEKILKLNDALSEDIILNNITDQLNETSESINMKINYVSLFRKKYDNISKEDDFYDEEYLKESLGKIGTVIGNGIKEKYGVELGEDLDFTNTSTYLEDMETLYEFLFIRHYENLVNFLSYRLRRDRRKFIEVYSKLMEDEKNSKDLFVVQSKKKFKNKEDVIIMHFLSDIMNDIKDSVMSSYELFEEICSLDKYEEYNDRMSELLINYGNKIVLHNDAEIAKKYLSPLNDSSVFSEIRNKILTNYLLECEINE